jgi:putative addiction module component (TIGR02574 family)
MNGDQENNVEQAWREEIERRIASIDEGTAKLVPWADVYARLKRRLKR